MDNDITIKKEIRNLVKRLKFKFEYRDINILDEEEGNNLIKEIINNSNGIMVARAGATEMRCVYEYIHKKTFSEKIRKEIKELSGVFPTDDHTLNQFCKLYIDSMKEADVLALWGVGAEAEIVHKYCMDKKYVKLRALEPYYFSNPWSEILKNKKLLIIHPFRSSILKQYEKRKVLFENESVLPTFEKITCIKAVQSLSDEKANYKDWFEALEYMEREIDKVDFDIAIIGAGAYSLPLVYYCKKINRNAIQMSGALQILFGIKGKRWDDNKYISSLYNDNWVRPEGDEIIKASNVVEGGSYW